MPSEGRARLPEIRLHPAPRVREKRFFKSSAPSGSAFFAGIFRDAGKNLPGRLLLLPCFPTGAEKRKCFFFAPQKLPPLFRGEKGPGKGKKPRRGEPPGMVFVSSCAWLRAPVPWWRLWKPWPSSCLRRGFPPPCRAWPEWRRASRAGAQGSSGGSA